jgi:hypothetical protein
MKEKLPLSTDKRTWRPSPLPGPIVLVTTLNADEGANIAPKSRTSMVAFEPALLAVGCDLAHGTARDILRIGGLVLNFPGEELAGVVFRCAELPHGFVQRNEVPRKEGPHDGQSISVSLGRTSRTLPFERGGRPGRRKRDPGVDGTILQSHGGG